MTVPRPLLVLGIVGGLMVTINLRPANVMAAQQPLMRVLVFEGFKARIRADSNKPLLLIGVGVVNKKVSGLTIRSDQGQLKISIDGRTEDEMTLDKKTQLRIETNDKRGIWLGNRRYRGELKVFHGTSGLAVVNHLAIEDYLKSVVGSEMPKSWPIEALKAQAVAARTYALKQYGKKPHFDVRATVVNQKYLGIESETKSTRRAVNSTRSLVLLHQGRLIDAVFHSSSGGLTAASSEVWDRHFPYLVSVVDHDQHSPKYRWYIWFTPRQLKEIFNESGGLNEIRILRKSPTERILGVQVQGPEGSLSLSGKQLRRRMGLESTRVSFEKLVVGDLPNYIPQWQYENNEQVGVTSAFLQVPLGSLNNESNPKVLEFKSDQKSSLVLAPPPLPSDDKYFVLLARGFGSGHGVGMSQWGAHGMALKGAKFRQILTYYYKGVTISSYK